MIQIPVSIGELLDKITILEIKIENISDPTKRGNCEKEYHILLKIAGENHFFFPEERKNLKKVNQCLWEIEDKLRRKEQRKEFDEEFSQMAREVYKLNDERAKIKRDINLLSRSEIIEEKEYVKYQESK